MNVKHSGTAIKKVSVPQADNCFAIDNKYISLLVDKFQVSSFDSEPLPLSNCTLNTTMIYGW
jgi:hypothetical protein